MIGAPSIRMVEDVLGCKWTVELLGQIGAGHSRPGQLRRAVVGISAKVMNERLAKLIGFGVLERRALSQKPLHVEYHLTAKGRQLAQLIDEIQQFCRHWDSGEARATSRSAGSTPDASARSEFRRPARAVRHRSVAS
jgi:DNA-binding HxlR family transcriptional regulator